MGAAYGLGLDPAHRWATIAFSECQVSPEIVYKRAGGQDIKLDVITAGKPSEIRPTVIFIHGGAWLSSSKEAHVVFPLPYLARGMNVVNVEYRMSPVSLAPAAVEDCRCALYWVFRNAKQYGFDTDKLIVAGESAEGTSVS
jgi:acetyl esterase/lipase